MQIGLSLSLTRGGGGSVAVTLDSLATQPTAGGGLKKLKSTYTGACLRVRRSSDDTEQDIGWSGSSIDSAAATTFANGSTLYVRGLYDQYNPAAYIAAQSTNANQPQLDLTGSEPRIITRQYGSGGAWAWFDLPAAVTADRRAFSCFMVQRVIASLLNANQVEFGSGGAGLGIGATPTSWGAWPVVGGVGQALTPNDGATWGTASKMIQGIVSNASNITIHRDGKTATAAAVSSNVFAGGAWGKTQVGNSVMDLHALVFFNSALSAGDSTDLKAALRTIFTTNPLAPAVSVGWQGDSTTQGAADTSVTHNNTVTKALSDLQPGWVIRNFGQSGRLIQNDTAAAMVTVGKTVYDDTAAISVAVLWEGINDLPSPRTAVQVYGDYTTWRTNAYAAGWDRNVICTLPPRTVGPPSGYVAAHEAQRVLLNPMIRANPGGDLCDAVLDLMGIAALGTDGNPNLTYLPDGLHPNDDAYTLMGPYALAAVNAAIANTAWTFARAAPLGWWDFTDANTRTIATGISEITDKSGNGRTLSQATGASQPTRLPAEFNGLDAARFDGVNDHLINSLPAIYAAGSATVLIVMKSAGQSDGRVFSEGNTGSSAQIYGPFRAGNSGAGPAENPVDAYGQIRNAASTVLINNLLRAAAFDNNLHVYGLIDAGNSLNVCVDGDVGTPVAYTRSGTLSPNRFALMALTRTSVDSFMGGVVAEVVILTTDATKRQLGEGRLAWKYARALAPGHPYASAPPTV